MKRTNILPRILVSLLGISFILWGTGNIALGLLGEKATAVITDIRREGGERADVKPGRYTYTIGYTFTLPGGKAISGFTKEIGSAVYSKANGTSTAQVRYFTGFPYINAMEKDTGLGLGPLVLLLVGGMLLFLMNFKRDIRAE